MEYSGRMCCGCMKRICEGRTVGKSAGLSLEIVKKDAYSVKPLDTALDLLKDGSFYCYARKQQGEEKIIDRHSI